MYAALMIGAIVFVIRAMAPQTIGEQARRYLETELQKHYVGFDISIGKGHYEPAIGIIFDDIRVADPSVRSNGMSWQITGTGSREILRIEKLTIVADTVAENLLEKRSPLITRRVVIDGVNVDTWLQDDGQLAIQKLWPLPKMGPAAPRIEVRRANLRLIDLEGNRRPLELDVSDLLVISNSKNSASVQASSSRALGAEPSLIAQAVPEQTVSLQAQSSFANLIQVQGKADASGLQVRGAITNAQINANLLDSIPAQFGDQLRELRGLDCVFDIAFALNHPKGGKPDYRVKATVHDGRFTHAKLPQPITQIGGTVLCDPSGVVVQASQGVCGDAVCRVQKAALPGYRWPEAATAELSITGLRLDHRLEKVLPPKLHEGWEKLQPNGRIDIVDANIFHRDGRWEMESTIDCKGVDIRHRQFPYPVEQLVGRIEMRNRIARCEGMHGRIGGRRLECAFHFPTKPESSAENVFVVSTDGPIAIDATLLNALTPRGEPQSKFEQFVRSLQPRGLVHLSRAKFATDLSGNKSQEVDLMISNGHLRYTNFAYPLYNVGGRVRIRNRNVQLVDFNATNANSGQIQCQGNYRMPVANKPVSQVAMTGQLPQPGGPQDSDLRLRFTAANIPMDDSLQSSLPAGAQQTWNALSPSGVLDHLDVLLTQQGIGAEVGLNITGVKSETQQLTNRNLSIQPTSLPYRLDITDANVNYDGSQVTIDTFSAKHGATRLSADGNCALDPNGRWQLMLDIHSGSRISPDSELIAALPNEMREAMHRLQLRRPISVRGKTQLLLADDRNPYPTIDWDVVFQLEGNRIGDVGPVRALRGELFSTGTCDAVALHSRGEVRIDSMHIDGLQVTNIRGPFSIDNGRLKLGSTESVPVPRSPTTPPPAQSGLVRQATFADRAAARKIQGNLFGGEVEMSGEVELSSASFDVDVALAHGKVPTLLADLGQGRSELTGVISVKAAIEGILGTRDLLKGVGSARVSGANVYQLPLLVQLLNLLRITPTEDVAFTDADVDFTLIEDQMTFNDLKLWGDLVALQGAGTLDRRGELDLSFNTRVSPQNAFTSVFRPLRSQRYTLWTVDVRGPLSSPTVERSSLDGVGQTLERLFPGMNGSTLSRRSERQR